MINGGAILDFFAKYYENYGYLIIFSALLLDNLIIFGLLLPAEFLVVMGGAFARQGFFSLATMCIVGWSGMMIGQSIAYHVGRYGLIWLLPKYIQHTQLPSAQSYIQKNGMMAVILAAFSGSSRTIVSAAIGVGRLPFHHFLIWQSFASAIWVIVFAGLGYLVGGQKQLVEKVIETVAYIGPGILVVWIIATISRRNHPL